MGLSYIIYEGDTGTGTRINKSYIPTTKNTIAAVIDIWKLLSCNIFCTDAIFIINIEKKNY